MSSPGGGSPKKSGRSRRKSKTWVTMEDVQAKYTFEKSIGEGSYGKVKLAIDNKTQGKVAIKIIPKDKVNSYRLMKEVRTQSLLQHPYIVRMIEYIELENKHLLVQEYVDGHELYEYIVARGKVHEVQARKMFRQILSALGYCHTNHVVHRDLKPENALITAKGVVKLIDFGFASRFEEAELLSTFCGSPGYAPPELLDAIEYHGPAADIWSLGIVLYAMTVGRLPFEGSTRKKMNARIRRARYKIPRHMSEDLADLLSLMLVADASQRATAADLATHPWVVHGYGKPPNFHIPHRSPVANPDKDAIALLTSIGFEEVDILTALEEDCHSSGTAPSADVCAYHMASEKVNSARGSMPVPRGNHERRRSFEETNLEPSERPRRNTMYGNTVRDAIRKAQFKQSSAKPRRISSMDHVDHTDMSPTVMLASPDAQPLVSPGPNNPAHDTPFVESPAGASTHDSAGPSSSAPAGRVAVLHNSTAQPLGPLPKKLRKVRGLSSAAATTTKETQEVAILIHSTLIAHKITFTQSGAVFTILFPSPKDAPDDAVRVDLEICRVASHPGTLGLRIKRRDGSTTEFKRRVTALLDWMQPL